MCGRYALYGSISRASRQFEVDWDIDFDERLRPVFDRYNVAPSQFAPVIRGRAAGGREIVLAKWGLIPSWVSEPSKAAKPVVAKSETAAVRPSFKKALLHSRVLVPASGFYEWRSMSEGKQPFFIRPRHPLQFFGFAGLLEHWYGRDGELLTFAILTTAANDLVRPIHDRMPVIVRPDDYDVWLDPGLSDAGIVGELMGPYPPDLMEAFAVGRGVGNVRADGPELVMPIDQGRR